MVGNLMGECIWKTDTWKIVDDGKKINPRAVDSISLWAP